MVIFLLDLGKKDPAYYLDVAIDSGMHRRHRMVGLLLSRGAIPTYPHVERVIKLLDSTMLTALLDAGAPVDNPSATGVSSLMRVIDLKLHSDDEGSMSMFKILLNRGANINRTTRYGRSALMKAALNGRAALAEELLKRSPDLTLRDRYGNTALDIALDSINTVRGIMGDQRKRIASMIRAKMRERTETITISDARAKENHEEFIW
jgi:hypothetical protein